MKKILILTIVFFVSLYAVNTFLPVHGEEKVYENTVRLHVIANSDSEEDQTLKLIVRDAVLQIIPSILEGCCDREGASRRIGENLTKIEETAERVIRENGYDYTCEVSLTDEKYPTKNYEGVCFPSGVYRSLQIKIGEHEGKNWWCVLYPGICLSGAKDAGEEFVEVGFTPEQYKVITETQDTKYKIRFKILEIFEDVVNP